MAEIWSWRRKLRVAELRLEGMSEAEAEASVPRVDMHVLDISFDALTDPTERRSFMNLPTSFVLPREDVDRLREVGARLLRESPVFAELVERFQDAETE
jgi:NTE family protein